MFICLGESVYLTRDSDDTIQEHHIHYTDQNYIADILKVICSVYKVLNFKSENIPPTSKQSYTEWKAIFGPVLKLCE